jgi:hypothetical protein
MWSRIADYFDLPAADYPASLSPLEKQMADDQAVWTQIVAESIPMQTSVDQSK